MNLVDVYNKCYAGNLFKHLFYCIYHFAVDFFNNVFNIYIKTIYSLSNSGYPPTKKISFLTMGSPKNQTII